MGFVVTVTDKGRFLYDEYAATLEAAREIYRIAAFHALERNNDEILDAIDNGQPVQYNYIRMIGYTVQAIGQDNAA